MGKSMRALHWAESKHPRDDRGRFAHKGGGKWMERVGEKAKAAFADVSLGYEPGRGPAGRLQTGKGGLIDIGGLSKAAKAAKAARTPEPPAGGHSGGREKVNPQSLNVGDRFLNAHGVEHEVISNPTSGRRAGAMVTRVKVRRVADGKEGPVTLDKPVTLTGGGGPEAPKAGRTAAGKVDTPRVSGETGGMKLPDQQSPTSEQLAGILRKHGLVTVAKDVEAGRHRKAATALHELTTSGKMRNVSFERRNAVRGVYNDLSRMPDRSVESEEFDGMTIAKLGREWVVSDKTKDGKTVHMYGSTTKADAEDWARTAAASRRAMRAGDADESHRIHAERTAALTGGEGRIYRPQGSVAKVSAEAAKTRAAGFRTPAGTKAEAPTGVDRVMKARSNKEKSAAFAALNSDEIVEAFQRDPGKALDAYMQKNFGKRSGRETALPPAVDNIAANLKAKNITPDQAAEQMRQWARVHAGMQHHKYMTLAADLTDGTVAKRRKGATPPKGDAGGGPGTKSAGASFLDEFKGDDNQLAKDTARGARVPGSKLPTTAGGNIKTGEARTANREARNAAAGHLTGTAALDAAPAKVRNGALTLPGWSAKDQAAAADALEHYRDIGFMDLNRDLRAGVSGSAKGRTTTAAIDRVMTASPLSGPVEIYRGVGDADIFNGGDTVIDKAPGSATADFKVAKGFAGKGAVLRMRVAAGVGAVNLSDMPGKGKPDEREGELLLQRGLQYRKTGERVENGVRVINVEVGPAGASTTRTGRTPTGLDTRRVPSQSSGMTETKAGPLPKVTGYAKGREVEAGMLINAADLLPMHESQGNTTGENPNPLGHADWVRVGLVGNTNTPEYRSYNSNRSLTGGMYVVFDQAGHPVGRMSANTIAEVNTADNQPKAALDIVRMPVKVKVKVDDGGGKSHIEERDGFEMTHVPSAFAQKEAGMPAPMMLREGVLDPKDPNYGKDARRPKPANRPHGPVVQGSRTREQYRADRQQRDAAYAASEPERAARRAEKEAQRKADAAVVREQERVEGERQAAIRREQYRRDSITRRHDRIVQDLADANPQVYDRNADAVVSSTPEEMAAFHLTQGSSDLKWLAATYGINARKMTLQEQAQAIAAAVKAGETPDLEVGAPKVLGEAEQAAADAKKIATADKRRRNEVTKNFDTLKAAVRDDETDPRFHWSGKLDPRVADHFSFHMSETQMRQLAEAFGLGALTGRALRDAIVEAIKAGRRPDLDAAPITSLKKNRR